MKTVLSIAGSDCSGGAGIQADLKTFAAHQVYGMAAIAAVVAENTSRVLDFQEVSPEILARQIDAVFEDIAVDAVKVGMLPSPGSIKAAAAQLREYVPRNVVVDPVMYAKNGCPLMEPAAVDALIQAILPLADVLTPNIPEAEKLAGMPIASLEKMETAARKIHSLGCKAVVVKGGHASGEAIDVLFDGSAFFHFSGPRINSMNTHGTGCTFSSAIAARLALGEGLAKAVEGAKDYVAAAIANGPGLGKGFGPTNHFFAFFPQKTVGEGSERG